MTDMFSWSHEMTRLRDQLSDRIARHLAAPGAEGLGVVPDPAALAPQLASLITPGGLGVDGALAAVDHVLLPNNIALDHPAFLAYIPAAPTVAASLFDSLVGAFSFSGESWQEAGGAIAAENTVLAWMASLAGLPEGAGGCFVSGGSSGNMSGLAVGRDTVRRRLGSDERMAVACASSAHASVRNAASLLDLEVLPVEADERGRLTGPALRAALLAHRSSGGRPVCAVVASAGATNTGAIDDLVGIADVAAEFSIWMHVDAAYGGGALASPQLRPQFAGIERCDSLVIDPHKWLFVPLDCGAVLYRDPALARMVHRQKASYLDAFETGDVARWNPSDYAYHLTRRARGLPLWFSLMVHGTDAMATAVDAGVTLAQRSAAIITDIGAPLRLIMEPQLSVVLFDRLGWERRDYERWCAWALAQGLGFIHPTRWENRDVGRMVFLHPDVSMDDVATMLRRAASDEPFT
jgi:aromatic-L-amino-acid/L-tryptophan decarboxylase